MRIDLAAPQEFLSQARGRVVQQLFDAALKKQFLNSDFLLPPYAGVCVCVGG